MMRYLLTIITLLSMMECSAQTEIAGYKLESGIDYIFVTDMKLNTETENNFFNGNVSLDIGSKIIFKLKSIDGAGNYTLRCRYQNLVLNFFSPGSSISISSQNKAFSPIHKYLNLLQNEEFELVMSPFGEFLSISRLDSLIHQMYQCDFYEAGKHEILIRTLEEAFGSNALRSLGNTCFFVYNENSSSRIEKNTSIYFNAGMKNIKNTFYVQAADSATVRIQGIGVIEEDIEESVYEQMKLTSNLKGSQTYDYLFDLKNGWIIKGVSKQRIQAVSTFSGHEDLPEGLQIPSYTETEFHFSGTIIED